MNRNKLVKLAVFKSLHIAEEFADACRKLKKVACTIPVWKSRTPWTQEIVGYEVKWADNWECFDLEG